MLFMMDVVAPHKENRLKGHKVPLLVEAVGDGVEGWPWEVFPLHDYRVGASMSLERHCLSGGW